MVVCSKFSSPKLYFCLYVKQNGSSRTPYYPWNIRAKYVATRSVQDDVKFFLQVIALSPLSFYYYNDLSLNAF